MFDRGDTTTRIRDLRSFDDAVLESPNVVAGLNRLGRFAPDGCMFDVHGDFEAACRAVCVWDELYRVKSDTFYARVVAAIISLCILLDDEGLNEVLAMADSWRHDRAYFCAWLCVCEVFGADVGDCVAACSECAPLIRQIFKNFDRLVLTTYNENEFEKILDERL